MTVEENLRKFSEELNLDVGEVQEYLSRFVDTEAVVDHYVFVANEIQDTSWTSFEQQYTRPLSNPPLDGEFYILTSDFLATLEVSTEGHTFTLNPLDEFVSVSFTRGENILVTAIQKKSPVEFVIFGHVHQEEELLRFTDNLKKQWMQRYIHH